MSGLAFHPTRMKSYTQTEQGDLAPDRALAIEGEITRGHDDRARAHAIDSEITATVDPGAGKDTAGGAVARARGAGKDAAAARVRAVGTVVTGTTIATAKAASRTMRDAHATSVTFDRLAPRVMKHLHP